MKHQGSMGSTQMIGIIDYGMGNLRSVQKAFDRLGAESRILSSPEGVAQCDRLVLPGVGAFADGMEHLNAHGWTDVIRGFIGDGRPFLGVCLGMQLLFEGSLEDAPCSDQPVTGLGVLPGTVERFEGRAFGPGRLKVPHMGWNCLEWQRPDPLLHGLPQQVYVYFVHSYCAVPQKGKEESVISARCDYGGPFCGSIWNQNLWGTQFHPEKSQRAGLQMLANFAEV